MAINVPYVDIVGLKLHVLGSDENLRSGFVEVKEHNAYSQNEPYPQGVYDLHMGTTNSEFKCATCDHKKVNCPGHSGYINLNYPVQSPLFIGEIKRWLKVICHTCGRTLQQDSVVAKLPDDRLSAAAKKLANRKNIACYYCDSLRTRVGVDKTDGNIITREIEIAGQKTIERIWPHEIEEIFARITQQTCELLGRGMDLHPSKLILRTLRVPPNTIRPDIKKISGGRTNNNDITVILQKIVNVNNALLETEDKNDDITVLETMVYNMIVGTSSQSKRGIATSSNRQLMSIAQRLPQKKGRIRYNLLGRRANFTARSFITCDPSLLIHEVGVPIRIARNLQVPVVVRSYNIAQVRVWFANASRTYPGCSKIYKQSTGGMHVVEASNVQVEIGDIVYRDLIDGDIVNFGRQPSLEPSSITSMHVRVIHDGDTIRMNVLQCPLFNADFDGDAMLLIIPRSQHTSNEIRMLSSPQERFISYKNSAPMIGEAQDSLIGTAELTRCKQIDRAHMMRILAQTGVWPELHDASSGRDAITAIMRERGLRINFERRAYYYNESQADYRNYNQDDINVKIVDGELQSGILDKSSIGEGARGGVFHLVNNQYSASAALRLSYEMQQCALAFLGNAGCTVSVRDILVNDENLQEIHDIGSALIADSVLISQQLNSGKIIAPLNKTINEYYEELQLQALDPGDRFWPPLLRSIDPEVNNFDKLIMYGSRGNIGNFRLVSTAIGQILLNGKRVPENYNRRSIAYFPRSDDNPAARGYVSNSYSAGLSIPEFIFSAMEARQQYVQTAVGTSVSGTWNRYGIKNFESLIIDNTRATNKSGRIVQMIYAGDGVDPRALKLVRVPGIMLNDKDFTAQYKSTVAAEFAALQTARREFIAMQNRRTIIMEMPFTDRCEISTHVPHMLKTVCMRDTGVPASPQQIFAAVDAWCLNLPYVHVNEIAQHQRREVPKYLRQAVRLLEIVVRLCCASTRVRISLAALRELLHMISLSHASALINYGCAIGVIAAQSVSEPITQKIIDSKHYVGQGKKLQSTVRIGEILTAVDSKKMKAPTMRIHLRAPHNASAEAAQAVANEIEMLDLRGFVHNYKIFYESITDIKHPQFVHEQRMISTFVRTPGREQPQVQNWCVRFELLRARIIEKRVEMHEFAATLQAQFKCYVVYSADGAQNAVLRVYFQNEQTINSARAQAQAMLQTIIRGVDGINGCFVKTDSEHYISTAGTNLAEILQNKYVDATRTVSDSIQEIAALLGINAARNKIVAELQYQLGSVARRHFSIYADEMTYTGKITSIDRFGSEKRDSSFLLRISDSSPVKVIRDSALHSKTDALRGISAPLLIGRSPHVGSLYNRLIVDQDYAQENFTSIESVLDEI